MFGDSLSDTGKMYDKMRGYLPPARPTIRAASPTARSGWSSSPSTSRACHRQRGGRGATAVAYNKISWNPKYQVINNLDYEVTQFLQKDSFKPDDLVILWVGANDYLAYGWNTEQDAKRVRDAISDAANRMVLNGAKQILLFNLPDLGQNPSARSQKVVEAASHVPLTTTSCC
jgi:phospholipase/lecithinase/hemolysin